MRRAEKDAEHLRGMGGRSEGRLNNTETKLHVHQTVEDKLHAKGRSEERMRGG